LGRCIFWALDPETRGQPVISIRHKSEMEAIKVLDQERRESDQAYLNWAGSLGYPSKRIIPAKTEVSRLVSKEGARANRPMTMQKSISGIRAAKTSPPPPSDQSTPD